MPEAAAPLTLAVQQEAAGARLTLRHLPTGSARVRSLSLPAGTAACSSEALEAIALAARFELLALLDDPALAPAPPADPAPPAVVQQPPAPTAERSEARVSAAAVAPAIGAGAFQVGVGLGPRVVRAVPGLASFGLGASLLLRRSAWLVGVAGEAEAPRTLNRHGTEFALYPAAVEAQVGAVILERAPMAIQLRLAAGASVLGRSTKGVQTGYAATRGAVLAMPHIALGMGVVIPFGKSWAMRADLGARLLLTAGHFVVEDTDEQRSIASASRVVPWMALELWHLRRRWNAP
ncbi:MAG: hypothetical protein RL385_2393 [Pseudomonadota bacterium]|jgi:hypothetical protein